MLSFSRKEITTLLRDNKLFLMHLKFTYFIYLFTYFIYQIYKFYYIQKATLARASLKLLYLC